VGSPVKDSRRKVAQSESCWRGASIAPWESRSAMNSLIDVTIGFFPVGPSFSATLSRGGTFVNVTGLIDVVSVTRRLTFVWG